MKDQGGAPCNPNPSKESVGQIVRPATSVDVARAAGVSQATVSRVLAPGSRIAGPMRERVLAAAVALGYRPNAIARSLASQRSGMIGIVMGDMRNPFYPQVLELFSDRLRRTGRQVLLFTVREGETVDDLLPELLQYQVDGVVIASANLSSGMARSCAALGTPVVLFNRVSKDAEVSSVCCENQVGGRLAADVLAQAGHRRLTFLAGTADTSTNTERLAGFTERCGELGLPAARRGARRLYARGGVCRHGPGDGVRSSPRRGILRQRHHRTRRDRCGAAGRPPPGPDGLGARFRRHRTRGHGRTTA